MSQKTKITKNSRVLVKRFDFNGNVKIKEATAVDAQRDCIKVKYCFGLFYWTEWLPIKSDKIQLEFIRNEPEN